jgi:PII-like signaling protein
MPYLNEETVLVRIFTRESKLFENLNKLIELGFEGFTAIRGIAGYGTTGAVSADITVESLDLPVVIEIFTSYSKFKEKAEQLRKLMPGLITLERTNLDP